MFDDPHGRAFLLPINVIKMSNITKNQVIDLPSIVGNATDSLDFGSVRLTTCIKAIDRLRRVIEELSMLGSSCEMKEVFYACQEMELMLEKSITLVDEVYIKPLDAFRQIDIFLEMQFPKS